MSKKNKNKICVYCGTRDSTTTDHVIARGFFPENIRANLPQVPSCVDCNSEKSKLEHYATTILPFGSRHKEAGNFLEKKVSRRLSKNYKLKRELRNGRETVWVKSNGVVRSTTALPIKGKEIIKLLEMMVRGFYFYNWETTLLNDHFVEVYSFTFLGLVLFNNKYLSMSPRNCIEKNFGNGVFTYKCTRGDAEPGISVWVMYFYNRLMITGGSNQELGFCGLTGPDKDRDKMSLKGI